MIGIPVYNFVYNISHLYTFSEVGVEIGHVLLVRVAEGLHLVSPRRQGVGQRAQGLSTHCQNGNAASQGVDSEGDGLCAKYVFYFKIYINIRMPLPSTLRRVVQREGRCSRRWYGTAAGACIHTPASTPSANYAGYII